MVSIDKIYLSLPIIIAWPRITTMKLSVYPGAKGFVVIKIGTSLLRHSLVVNKYAAGHLIKALQEFIDDKENE
jgi:hypothetical protein